MAGQEYTGKDKIVQKISRDGLTEENLHEGTSKRNKKYQNTKELIREPPSRAAPSVVHVHNNQNTFSSLNRPL